jgi:hypothetical protein
MPHRHDEDAPMLRPAFCCFSLLAASQAFACFTVTSARDQVVYHSVDPPVDMSRPIHETLPRVFPGGHMVFDLRTDCPRATPPPTALAAPSRDTAVVRVLSEPGPLAEVSTAALVADLGPRSSQR